jgi:hypothetical protein
MTATPLTDRLAALADRPKAPCLVETGPNQFEMVLPAWVTPMQRLHIVQQLVTEHAVRLEKDGVDVTADVLAMVAS